MSEPIQACTEDEFTLEVDIFYFFSAPRMALTVVPQTEHWPFKAGLPFFMVTFWPFFISVLVLHFTQ